MATLLLRLSAPLQSWGSESKFETRRTEKFPTKSGVIGLIASALGYSREDSLEKLNTLKFGVRIDHEGELIRDYHVAKTEKASYVTNRYYLSDAVFLAGIETSDTAFLDEIETALKNPVFPLFLGKRSCPPTMPLFLGIRQTDLLTALRNEPLLYEQRNDFGNASEQKVRIIIDSDSPAEVIRDVPISFSKTNRKFGFRNVRSEYAEIPSQPDFIPTTHNPF
ncbi:MAG: type I-E CRISPR-associated protein Cas5/CasD [Oscillospiraceae bacterium]